MPMFSFFKSNVTKSEKIDKDTLEELLLEADIDYEFIETLLEPLSHHVSRPKLQARLEELFTTTDESLIDDSIRPFVDVVIGINGAGKTTTIAKLAHLYKTQGYKVLLGASDTFRAAAIQQLQQWATRLDIDIVASQQGHDPSAVAFDAISKGVAKAYDRVIIDTAGRLHTQSNLANELKKIIRVSQKALPTAPHRKLLVIDGTQGSSAIQQAINFHEMIGLDGIIITKLDGTVQGGTLFSIAQHLSVPILFIGTGEGINDLKPFDKHAFIDTLLDELYT